MMDKWTAIMAAVCLAFLMLWPMHRPATWCSAPPCVAPVVQDGGSGIIPLTVRGW